MNKPLSNYSITEKTMVLFPAAHMDYQTIVLEPNQKLFIRQRPLELIKQACLETFCTYEGKRTATMLMTGYKRKTPVPINPYRNICAFPTKSPDSFDCIWIFPSHVKSINGVSSCIILFNDEQELLINVSRESLETQTHRTLHCLWKASTQLMPASPSGFLVPGSQNIPYLNYNPTFLPQFSRDPN